MNASNQTLTATQGDLTTEAVGLQDPASLGMTSIQTLTGPQGDLTTEAAGLQDPASLGMTSIQILTGPHADLTTEAAGLQDPASLGMAFVLTRWMWLLWPPLVLAGGTFGNLASLLTLRRLGCGGSASSPVNVYLLALAVSDLVMLHSSLLRYWLLEVRGRGGGGGRSLELLTPLHTERDRESVSEGERAGQADPPRSRDALLAGQPLECQFLSDWYDSIPEKSLC